MYTAKQFQDAFHEGVRDIEIRAHLDLRNLSSATAPVVPVSSAYKGPYPIGVAGPSTRSIRVRVTGWPHSWCLIITSMHVLTRICTSGDRIHGRMHAPLVLGHSDVHMIMQALYLSTLWVLESDVLYEVRTYIHTRGHQVVRTPVSQRWIRTLEAS